MPYRMAPLLAALLLFGSYAALNVMSAFRYYCLSSRHLCCRAWSLGRRDCNSYGHSQIPAGSPTVGSHKLQKHSSFDPAWGRGIPFRLCCSLVHSLPHLLLFITFSLFSFFIHFTYFPLCPSDPFLPESSHSVSRREVVGGDRTWV